MNNSRALPSTYTLVNNEKFVNEIYYAGNRTKALEIRGFGVPGLDHYTTRPLI